MATTVAIRSKLQEWIDNAGETYSSLSEETGVSIPAISRLANNRFDRVDCKTWKTLCGYFERPIQELFYDDETE